MSVRCVPGERREARNTVLELADGPLHVSSQPISADNAILGELMIVHDMSFAQRRSEDTRKYVLWLFAAIAAVVALITVVIAEISWRGWVAGLKAVLSGGMLLRSPAAIRNAAPELRPIARDLQALVSDLENERRTRDESQTTWGPDALRRILRQDLKGDEVIIVSNREPYIHTRRKDNVIEIQRPASGLVTALEPVMRACSGTWIAHGAGSADRDTVDRHDHVMVPPDKPSYRIRRVWLSEEEEKGYYFGFANEGLWPLCHIAHTRPDLPRARLGALQDGQPPLRRRGRRRGAHRRPDRAGAGLSLRAAAAHGARAPAARDHHHLLAHPLAQPGGVRHLPVARGGARRHARLVDPRLPHAVPLQQLLRHRRPLPRGARRPRDLHHLLRRRADRGAPLPDLDRVAAERARGRRRRCRNAASACARCSACRRT